MGKCLCCAPKICAFFPVIIALQGKVYKQMKNSLQSRTSQSRGWEAGEEFPAVTAAPIPSLRPLSNALDLDSQTGFLRSQENLDPSGPGWECPVPTTSSTVWTQPTLTTVCPILHGKPVITPIEPLANLLLCLLIHHLPLPEVLSDSPDTSTATVSVTLPQPTQVTDR